MSTGRLISHYELAQFCDEIYHDTHQYFAFPVIGEVEAAAKVVGDVLAIGFRGTEITVNWRSLFANVQDIVRDFCAIPVKTVHGVFAHRGFYQGALKWSNYVDPHLLQIFPKFKRLCLTGHSLGAALAVQYAMLTKWDICQVTLFGEPRGLFKSAREYYKEVGLATKTTTYREGNDLVTFLPPWGYPSKYPKCVGVGGFYDHSVTGYKRALEAYIFG